MMALLTWTLAITALLGAFLSIVRKNPIRGAVGQFASILAVAGLLALQGSELAAVTLAIGFGSALCVFALTVVMLLDVPETEREQERVSRPGVVLSLFLLAPLTALCCGAFMSAEEDMNRIRTELAESNLERSAPGDVLAGSWIYAFEAASFLFLAGIVATLFLARRRS